VQALSNTAGGVTGVFGTGASKGGAYCNVNTYAHIIWVAQSTHANNPRMCIGYTEDGGFAWTSKEGNWTTAMGLAYDGGGDGGVGGCPMPAYANI
jgi:hypothetical protein